MHSDIFYRFKSSTLYIVQVLHKDSIEVIVCKLEYMNYLINEIEHYYLHGDIILPTIILAIK